MVSNPPHTHIPRLNAYLTTAISPSDLAMIKSSFELGACSRFNPMLELFIKDVPSYHGKSPAVIRRSEEDAGRTAAFVVIDDQSAADGAVWYVERYATADEVAVGLAETADTVIKIRMKTECLAVSWVNYSIGHMSVTEDLESCGVNFPISNDCEQETPCDCGGMDMTAEQWHQIAWVVAKPGEFDASTDDELRRDFLPKPEKVARLKDGIAKEHGVFANWTLPCPAKCVKLEDGSEKVYPEGSLVLQCTYDPDFAWPEYKWPEGSL